MRPLKRAALFASASVLAVAVTIGIFMVVGGRWRSSSDVERPSLSALVAALGQRRPVEGRVSGDFAWGPYASPKRADTGASMSSSEWGAHASLLAAADAIRRQALATPDDALALGDLGVAHLVTGAPRKAVDVLEDARDRRPTDPRILNDLAAAYLARGRAHETAEDLARALDAAERGTRLDPSRLEAWFNRALALERLRLDEAARLAWRDYLRRDLASPWADEARKRLRDLESHPAPIAAADLEAALASDLAPDTIARMELNLSPVRDYVDNELLPRWAAQTLAANGLATADVTLHEAADRLAAQVARIGGDPYLRDIAATTSAATPASSRARLALANGILARRDARAALDRSDVERASAPLARARSILASHRGLALDVELYQLIADVQRGQREAALPRLESHERRSAASGYRYLAARAALLHGLIQFRLANFAEALQAFDRAVSGFRQAREGAFLATALTYLSEALSAVGQHERAWESQIEAFGLLDLVSDPRRRHAVLVTGGLLPLQGGLDGAALHVQQAAIENARQWNVAASHVAARLQLARSLVALDRRADARTTLTEAKTWAARISDTMLRDQYLLELTLAEGDVGLAGGDAPAAIAAYSDALRGLGAIKSWYRLSPIYLKRGRAHALRDDWDSAERDWREGLALVEQQRRTLQEQAQRIAHLDEMWDLYAGLIEIEALRRGNAETALRLAERGRARVLFESMAEAQVLRGLASVAVDQRPLTPAGTTAVVYMTLERQLLIWVVSDQSARMTTVDISRVALHRLVSAFRDGLREAGETTDLSRRLYALIWAPIASQLEGKASVVIVPDGPLASLPFAALDDRRTYLIERHALSLAPSLATLRIASQRIKAGPAEGAASRHALIAADPAIDRARHPDLPALSAAREEADGIASLYERPTVLRGREVTKSRLIAELPRADFLHFAGHAISNDVRPDLAHLVVAPSDQTARDMRLEVGEIAKLRLDDVRLVVLSACQTGTGRVSRGEGTLSLARPFLIAGVPTVIATLWLVDDRLARDMMLDMHRRLRAGDAPDVALQRVQLARLREARNAADSRRSPTNPDLAWADFVVIGAAHAPHR